jgi:autotransporter-associated beta strand protein
MKITTPLLACAVLAAGLAAQTASATVFTVQVNNSEAQGAQITWATSAVAYNQTKAGLRNNGATSAGKAWIQFNLSNVWATYGEGNLTNATLKLWNANGSSRKFYVAALANNSGQENWYTNGNIITNLDLTTTTNGLTWFNAPANNTNGFSDPQAGYGFVWTNLYSGTNIWQVDGTTNTADIVDVHDLAYSQNATYTSISNTTTQITAFLKTDSDGLVTFMMSGSPANNNQSMFIGVPGSMPSDPALGSPLLTLTFDVRVALIGGGPICSSDINGVDVSLAGSDAGVNYFLFTNGVYAGQTVAGTGSAVDFGMQHQPATYTALASNTTTHVTTTVTGSPTVSLAPPLAVSVQPVSVFAATNSIALFSVVGNTSGLTYQWYRNGVTLTNGGQYSGTTSNQLVINPVLAANNATTVDGYYCALGNACGDLAFSTTNALTIQVANNLVWQGTPTNSWDIATTANWTNSAGAAVVFNPGDNVTLDDTRLNTTVSLASHYLSPGTITFNASSAMVISGGGDISGPSSSLIVKGPTLSSQLQIQNQNSFGGGTVINDGWLTIANNFALGTNTVTLAGTGQSLLLVTPSGGAGIGIPGINVTANSTLEFDGTGAYAGEILGGLTGTAGKQLTIYTPNAVAGNNVRVYGGDFTNNCDIALNINGANFATYNNSGTFQTYNGVISGNGILYPRNNGATVILNGPNTFTATVFSQANIGVGIDSALPSNSPLGLGTVTVENAGNITIFASGGAHTIENPLAWTTLSYPANSTVIFGGNNQLTWSGTIDLSAAAATNNVSRTVQVTNTAPTIFSGVIGDQGQNCGLNKTGNGALYLNNANTYTGPTTNSAGLLAGSGSVAGSVFVTTSSAKIGGGTATSMGTFSVGGDLNLTTNAGGFFRVNRSGSLSDYVSVTGGLTNSGTGTITITNLGAALQVNDSFTLFSKAVSGGSTLNVSGGNVNWNNHLATDGSIQVASLIVTYPTNINHSVSGSTLTISWPATHLGWILQNQTNSATVGLSTNWVDMAGSSFVTYNNVGINPSNPAVFYRLRQP